MTQTGEAKTATLFTPESANRALPYVRAVVADLVDACSRLHRAEEARARATAGRAGTVQEHDESLRQAEDARRSARADRDRTVRELAAAGVEVKDAETGLVDFPGEMDGRRVYLCWRHGEDRVAFWHDLDSGFPGRRPLPAASSRAEDTPPEGALDEGAAR